MSQPDPRIEELFHACRALATEVERRAFLERAAGGDAALRARVEHLLAADAGASASFLAPAPAVPGEHAGQTIGRYKLLQEIGRGGMGTVWMAEQREPVVRKVALKIINLGMDTREVVVRFEAERQALALMDHPHIAKVLDGGATESGRPYFVMDLVKGVPITEYCDKARLGLRERLELFAQVCEAIQHAHHKGIIHRDIKPSNVLVTLHDGVAVPKVIDFGIAKATSAELTKKTMFTQFAQILGTPEYMAPEQAEMSGLDIDTRADVYSLGVLLYELLTGTKPFDIETALDVGFQELLRTIREVDPAKPSTRVSTLGDRASPTAANRQVNVEALSRRLRGDLDWIVMKALEKDRTRRYDTPNSFAADIGRFLRDEAVVAAPPSAVYRFRKAVRRRKKTVAAVALIALLLVGGIVGTSLGLLRAVDEKTRADVAAASERTANAKAQANALRAMSEATRAEAEAQRARAAETAAGERADELEKVASFQESQLAVIDPQSMGARLRQDLVDALPETRRKELKSAVAGINFTSIALHALESNVFRRSLAAIEAQFGEQPQVEARLLQTSATTLRLLGLLDAASPPQERALEIRTRLLGADHPATLSSASARGILQKERGQLAEAEKGLRAALEGRRRVLGPDSVDTLDSLHDLGAILRIEGRYDEAGALFSEALAGRRRLLGNDHPQTLDTLNSTCTLLANRGRYEEAEPAFDDTVERFQRVFGDGDPRTLNVINGRATMLADLDRLDEAEKDLRAVLSGCRRAFGDDHPATLTALNNLGALLERRGSFADSKEFLVDAVEIRRRVLGDDHPDTLMSIYNLGALLLEQREFAASEPYMREALEGDRRVLGDAHRDTLVALNGLAGLLNESGRPAEALPLFTECLAGMRRVFGDDHEETLTALNNMGAVFWSLGRPAEAIPYLREALERQRRVSGDAHHDTLMVAANLGMNCRAAGSLPEAQALFEEVQRGRRGMPDLQWVGVELLSVYANSGDREKALAFARELLVEMRASRKRGSVELGQDLSRLGTVLLQFEAWSEAEPLLRECVDIREKKQPDAWSTFNAQSLLGGALLGQRRFAEAEPLLIAGCEGMLQRESVVPVQGRVRIDEALQRLVALYDAREAAEPGAGHAAQAATWRARIDARKLDSQR